MAAVSGREGVLSMFARLPHWARTGRRRTVWLSRRQGYLIALAALLAAVFLLGACAVSASGEGPSVVGTVRPLPTLAQSTRTQLANAASTPPLAAATKEPTAQSTIAPRPTATRLAAAASTPPLAAATATAEPTARPTITPRPTVTPQATATPQPTATPQSTATPNTSGVIFFSGKTNSDAGFAVLSIVVLLLCFAVIGLIVWLVARNSAAKHAAAQQQAAASAAMAGPGMTPGMTPGQMPPPGPPGTQSEWEQTERYRTETPGMPNTYPQGPQTPPPGGQPPYQGGQSYQGGQPYQQGGQPYQGGQ